MKKDIPNRNAQFENITRLTAEYQTAGNSILSMDTKKKEHLGNFYREGHLYMLETDRAQMLCWTESKCSSGQSPNALLDRVPTLPVTASVG